MTHPNCAKLGEVEDEWNAIGRFLEWLNENKMCIGVWRDPDTPYYNSYTDKEEGTIKENAEWLLEHPYPFSNPMPNLLYKYFDVDPTELEKERRQILANLQTSDETGDKE